MKHKKIKTDQTKPKGKSKYALKVQRRKAVCRRLGIADTPWPILWQYGIR